MLARLSGDHCLKTFRIWIVLLTFTDSRWRRSYSRSASVTRTFEVFFYENALYEFTFEIWHLTWLNFFAHHYGFHWRSVSFVSVFAMWRSGAAFSLCTSLSFPVSYKLLLSFCFFSSLLHSCMWQMCVLLFAGCCEWTLDKLACSVVAISERVWIPFDVSTIVSGSWLHIPRSTSLLQVLTAFCRRLYM